jgi:hypothetical protein
MQIYYKYLIYTNMIQNFNIYKIKSEILAKEGWIEKNPENIRHLFNLSYKLNDKVSIELIQDKKEKIIKGDFIIYLKDNNQNLLYKIGYYLTPTNELYRTETDPYKRMFKICNYLLPYFNNKPSDDLINVIIDIFINISDLTEDKPMVKWGYHINDKYGFFPAFNNKCKLGLFLSYKFTNNKIIPDLIKEFKNSKYRLQIVNINSNKCSYDFEYFNENSINDSFIVKIYF